MLFSAVVMLCWNNFYVIEFNYSDNELKIYYYIEKYCIRNLVLAPGSSLEVELHPFNKKLSMDYETFGMGAWTIGSIDLTGKKKILANFSKSDVNKIQDWIQRNQLN